MAKITLLIIVLLSFLPQFVVAENPPVTVTDSIRIARLAGLCELWGVVNYFHPFIAYRDINWDDALVKSIPRVNMAVTAEDYKRAIDYLLSFLKDPNTFVRDKENQFIPPQITGMEAFQPYLTWTDDTIAIIAANNYNSFQFSFDHFTMMDNIMREVAGARGVIIDARRLDNPEHPTDLESIHIDGLFHSFLPRILKKPLNLPSTRFLTYSGEPGEMQGRWMPVTRNFSYRSGYHFPGKFEGDESPKIVLVTNEGSDRIQRLAVALQENNQAAVLFEGPFWRELGVETFPVYLPDDIVVEVRLDEMVRSDGTSATHPDLVIPFTTDTTFLASPPIVMAMEIINGTRETPPAMAEFLPTRTDYDDDSTYSNENLPSLEYRILAVSKFWNAVKYFYPFSDKIDLSLKQLLSDFIIRMEAVDSRITYVTTLAQMAARLNDSNADVESSVLDEYLGEFRPHFEAKYVEGRTVVNRVVNYPQKYIPELDPGDIILAIDEEDINNRRARLRQYLSASTPQASEIKIDSFVLSGDHSSNARVAVMKANGDTIEVQTKRSVMYPPLSNCRNRVEVFESGIGYIDMSRICFDIKFFINDILDSLRETSALIVDMRGYNGTCEPAFLRYLMKRDITASQTRIPGRNSPDCSVASWVISEDKLAPPENGEYYDKEIAVLIDGTTFHEAERFCLFLKNGADAILIGMPTNGTIGRKTGMRLPGGVRLNYTETDVRYPDGRSIQGIGIQPDIPVIPTIKGIREERDEIFEAAYTYLKDKIK